MYLSEWKKGIEVEGEDAVVDMAGSRKANKEVDDVVGAADTADTVVVVVPPRFFSSWYPFVFPFPHTIILSIIFNNIVILYCIIWISFSFISFNLYSFWCEIHPNRSGKRLLMERNNETMMVRIRGWERTSIKKVRKDANNEVKMMERWGDSEVPDLIQRLPWKEWRENELLTFNIQIIMSFIHPFNHPLYIHPSNSAPIHSFIPVHSFIIHPFILIVIPLIPSDQSQTYQYN